MVLTKQEYVSAINDSYPSQKISLITLVETIINKFGKDNSMKEDELDDILSLILSELKDLAFAVSNHPVFSQNFNFHFDTSLGKGFVTKK